MYSIDSVSRDGHVSIYMFTAVPKSTYCLIEPPPPLSTDATSGIVSDKALSLSDLSNSHDTASRHDAHATPNPRPGHHALCDDTPL